MHRQCVTRYILEGTIPIPVPADINWWTWYGTADRVVHKTLLPDGTRVSTVFLGRDFQQRDGPPLLFETLVVGGLWDQARRRYSTWEEASQGHEMMVVRCGPANPTGATRPLPTSPPASARNSPQKGARCSTKAGYVAAISEPLLDQSLAVLRQGDTAAYAQLLATGRVIQMAADVPVYIQDRHAFRRTIQVRPEGHTGAFWTTFDAVQCTRSTP